MGNDPTGDQVVFNWEFPDTQRLIRRLSAERSAGRVARENTGIRGTGTYVDYAGAIDVRTIVSYLTFEGSYSIAAMH